MLRQFTAFNCFHLLLKLTLTLALNAATGKFRVCCRVLFGFTLIVFQYNVEAFFLTCIVVGIIDN